MKSRSHRIIRPQLLLLALALFSLVLGVAFAAAEINPLQPGSWFGSEEALFAAGALLAGWLVKLATALGKDWFGTEGSETVILSGAMSVLIAGVGGYFTLGFLAETGAGGFAGALRAMAMALLAWLGANASAKYDRQAAAASAERIERAKARLQ